ncbi:MAG: hypothetical protein GY710_07135 [Desulfobacteraceae bacterium]|nr:hypothetical protein [Desulfobacteraceae bacterium]
MLYELREYTIVSGMLTQWISLMNTTILPFQAQMGMNTIGSYASLSQEDIYIWIRCYKDEKEKQELYDKVYGSEYWKSVLRKKIDPMLVRKKTRVVMMKPV